MRARSINRGLLALAGPFIALALSGCTSDVSGIDPSDPYASQFSEALEFASSDFEREVLSDGQITRDEYVEAHNRWLECIEVQFPPGGTHTAGWVERDNGLIEYVLASPAGVDSADRAAEFERLHYACANGTVDIIAGLYNDIALNPTNASQAERLFACLDAESAVPPGYTVDDLESDWESRLSGDALSVGSPLTEPLSPTASGCIAGLG